MKRKTRKYAKSISLILSVIMLICVMPLSTSATEEITEQQQASTVSTPSDATILEEFQIIEDDTVGKITEVESLREENVKHFKLPDGSYEAVVYAEAVHRKDASGQWQDINNNLSGDNAKAPNLYATDDLRVAFPKSFAADQSLFSLNENGYSISMRLLSEGLTVTPISPVTETVSASTVSVTNAPTRANAWNTLEDAANVYNSSSIKYRNVRNNVDIEYILDGNDVKENIIIKGQSNSYSYRFGLELSGLTPTLRSDGSISLADIETNEIKYTIPAPFMYDATGEMSYDVSYTLTPSGTNYILTVIADSDWINAEGRAFPVTVDPSINSYQFVMDTYVDANNPNTNYGLADDMVIRDGTMALIIMGLPTNIPLGSIIVRATMNVPCYTWNVEGDITCSAYQVLEYWEDDVVTYNTAPQISSTPLSTLNMTVYMESSEWNPSYANFEITNLLKQWLAMDDVINFGIAIKRDSGVVPVIGANTYDFSTDYCTYMTINYAFNVLEGVYAFSNYTSGGRWLSVEMPESGRLPQEGARIQQKYSTASPTVANIGENDTRASLFKISAVSMTTPRRYVIRSMLDNTLSISISGTNVVTKKIPYDDYDVEDADTFHIEWNGTGYTIRPYNSTTVITMTDTSTANLTTVDSSSATTKAYWYLSQYVRDHKIGATLYYPQNAMIAGNAYPFSAVTWSTKPNYNTPAISVAETYSCTVTENIGDSETTYSVFWHHGGTFTVCVGIYNESKTLLGSVTFSFTILLPVEEGIYFFKNAELDGYMQNDDSVSSTNENATFELWNFIGSNKQRWNVEHIIDGYYKITSIESGMVATAPTSLNSCITQSIYTGTDSQQWIFHYDNGLYKISPKSNSLNYISAGSGIIISNGRNVELREEQSNNYDEWYLYKQKDYTLMYIGNGDGDEEMPDILNSVDQALQNDAQMQGYAFTSLDKEELIVYLSSSSFFSCITHGTRSAISTSSEPLTLLDIEALDNDAFVNLEFVYLGACETGTGSDNLVNAIYNKGANAVLGFTGEVFVIETNLWTEAFMKALASGTTIEDAMTVADVVVEAELLNLEKIPYRTTDSAHRYFVGSDQIVLCE